MYLRYGVKHVFLFNTLVLTLRHYGKGAQKRS